MKKLLFLALFFPAPVFAGGLISIHNSPPAATGGADPCAVTGTTVAYRSHVVTSANTAANITINKPAGTVEGDLMIAVLYADANSWSPTPPTDWLLYASTANLTTSPDTNNKTYYKRAGASEGASYQWTFSSAFRQGAIMTIKDNNANASCGPLETDFDLDVGDGGYSVEMDMAYNNTLVVIAETNFDGNAQTAPTGYTERFDSSNIAMMTEDGFSAGSTGAETGTVAGSAPFAVTMIGVID